ncbi:hypothetical protein BDV38DRAFT_106764 [Aspergillus pseudotamarii]|uniref:Uncharacterized protein n=1 Tax=Aspergillus pseudotamarii TaxID=132259 RepID=A0A5N6SST1_ASPPS|nr:uncharacterized protein BDV38DRAFT_106764 [Aspergillus pseudotamarii]KAE8136937.1 hypothetical protein BDV38DRAFT_106764 [Aspergillus pseudotamarii]
MRCTLVRWFHHDSRRIKDHVDLTQAGSPCANLGITVFSIFNQKRPLTMKPMDRGTVVKLQDFVPYMTLLPYRPGRPALACIIHGHRTSLLVSPLRKRIIADKWPCLVARLVPRASVYYLLSYRKCLATFTLYRPAGWTFGSVGWLCVVETCTTDS